MLQARSRVQWRSLVKRVLVVKEEMSGGSFEFLGETRESTALISKETVRLI